MSILRISPILIIAFVFLVSVGKASAFEDVNMSYFGGVAVGGYDAVSYFEGGKPIKGDEAFVFEWKKATWLFSSDTNRQLFATNPEMYAPQYGGYCSNQMSLGNLSDIDPLVWRIIDNKLYLFGHDQGRVRWSSETLSKVHDADKHWQTYLEQ